MNELDIKKYKLFLHDNKSILFNYHDEDFVKNGLEYNLENDGSFIVRDEWLLLERNALIFATDVSVIFLGYRTKPTVLYSETL